MKNRQTSRRTILLACGASVAAAACGGADDDANAGGSNAGGSNAGGSNAGGMGTGAGGTGTGGMGTGGMGTGGMGTGGGMSVCGGAILVRGSNYASDPHDFTIPVADVVAGQTKSYSTTGESHTHDVTVTAADFAALQNGETVRIFLCFTSASFTDHEFTISCTDPNVAPLMEGDIGTEGNCPG